MTGFQTTIVNRRGAYGENSERNCSIGTFQGLDAQEMDGQRHPDDPAVRHLLRLHPDRGLRERVPGRKGRGVYQLRDHPGGVGDCPVLGIDRWFMSIWANNVYDKEVDAIKQDYTYKEGSYANNPGTGQRLFGFVLSRFYLHYAGDHLLGGQAHQDHQAILCRRPQHHRFPERPGPGRGLHVGRLLPGDRRHGLPEGLRRHDLCHRLAGGLAGPDVPDCRTPAQPGQVHLRRRGGLSAEAKTHPHRRGHRRHPGSADLRHSPRWSGPAT